MSPHRARGSFPAGDEGRHLVVPALLANLRRIFAEDILAPVRPLGGGQGSLRLALLLWPAEILLLWLPYLRSGVDAIDDVVLAVRSGGLAVPLPGVLDGAVQTSLNVLSPLVENLGGGPFEPLVKDQ